MGFAMCMLLAVVSDTWFRPLLGRTCRRHRVRDLAPKESALWSKDVVTAQTVRRSLHNGLKPVGRQLGHLRLQILHLQVGVALGGRHPGMAQQFLHRSQVRPGAQGVGGEGVAQYMWPGAISDAG